MSSCTEPNEIQPKSIDIPGQWCDDYGQRFIFQSDGRFELRNLSKEYLWVLIEDPEYTEEYVLKRDFAGSSPRQGSGRWWLSRQERRPPKVWLNFDSLDSFEFHGSDKLRISEIDNAVALLRYEGDIDQGYSWKFTNCQ